MKNNRETWDDPEYKVPLFKNVCTRTGVTGTGNMPRTSRRP